MPFTQLWIFGGRRPAELMYLTKFSAFLFKRWRTYSRTHALEKPCPPKPPPHPAELFRFGRSLDLPEPSLTSRNVKQRVHNVPAASFTFVFCRKSLKCCRLKQAQSTMCFLCVFDTESRGEVVPLRVIVTLQKVRL